MAAPRPSPTTDDITGATLQSHSLKLPHSPRYLESLKSLEAAVSQKGVLAGVLGSCDSSIYQEAPEGTRLHSPLP